MYRLNVSLDCIGYQAFPALTHGGNWNGWAKPLFDYETAKEILDQMKRENVADYSVIDGVFLVGYPDDEIGDPVEEYRPISIEFEGEHRIVYALGSGSWVWWPEDANE